jgi:NADH dehydrogenase
LANLIGPLVRDRIITRDELNGLMAELVVTDGPATGETRLVDWLARNASTLGKRYASEIARHYR